MELAGVVVVVLRFAGLAVVEVLRNNSSSIVVVAAAVIVGVIKM